jgi:hypothetical protein
MIQEFYYGSSWHWPLPYLPRVMLSYNMLRKIKTLWKIDIPFMMDSGAFAVILKYGKYPFTQEEYASGNMKIMGKVQKEKESLISYLSCNCISRR